MQRDDERDLERALEEKARRLFDAMVNARTDAERKKAERELAEHIARPGRADSLDDLAREFEIRLKGMATLPPGAPAEYREAFGPLLERMATVPPFDKWTVPPGWDLWTRDMVYFHFQYGVEPLRALLCLKVFGMLSPAPPNVDAVEADVFRCADRALELFVDALSGRLGSLLDQTLNEVAVRAIDELRLELNNVEKGDVPQMREFIIDEWQKVEKVRIGVTPGPATFNTKEAFEALIDKAQAELKPMKMDQTKTAVLAYINNNYPDVLCGSVKQLNRLLKKFGIEHKFPVENAGQISE